MIVIPKATMYGQRWPLWWVRMRGKQRIRLGYCPWCYSSPPHNWCPVCEGWTEYGVKCTRLTRSWWRYKFFLCLGGLPSEYPDNKKDRPEHG